jgi:hypothetical protein
MGLDKGYRKMPILLGKWKIGGGRCKASVMQLWLERMTCPAFKVVFVVSFGAGESKSRKELHSNTLRPYHHYKGIPSRHAS